MDFHPNAALVDLDLTSAPTDSVEPTQTCWNAILGEAHKVIQVTLEELALLAGLATAATEVPGQAPAADVRGQSSDAALAENGLFSLRT